MNKLATRLEHADITIDDLVVCPIDDHATIGIQVQNMVNNVSTALLINKQSVENIKTAYFDNAMLYTNCILVLI